MEPANEWQRAEHLYEQILEASDGSLSRVEFLRELVAGDDPDTSVSMVAFLVDRWRAWHRDMASFPSLMRSAASMFDLTAEMGRLLSELDEAAERRQRDGVAEGNWTLENLPAELLAEAVKHLDGADIAALTGASKTMKSVLGEELRSQLRMERRAKRPDEPVMGRRARERREVQQRLVSDFYAAWKAAERHRLGRALARNVEGGLYRLQHCLAAAGGDEHAAADPAENRRPDMSFVGEASLMNPFVLRATWTRSARRLLLMRDARCGNESGLKLLNTIRLARRKEGALASTIQAAHQSRLTSRLFASIIGDLKAQQDLLMGLPSLAGDVPFNEEASTRVAGLVTECVQACIAHLELMDELRSSYTLAYQEFLNKHPFIRTPTAISVGRAGGGT